MQVDGYEFVFRVGGDLKNSSSWILKRMEVSTERRVWGEFSTCTR